MTTLFISDLHLTPDRPATSSQFSSFMRGPARHSERLFILGDLFEYWIGIDAIELLGLGALLQEISDLVASGTEVLFIAGNRDFLVGNDFAERTGISILADGSLIDLGARPALVMHGDSLCTDDTDHQAFRRMVLNPAWQAGFLSRPLEERVELAKEARLLSTESTSQKSMDIMDVNSQTVTDIMKRHDVDLLIHGHTHRPKIHLVDLNGHQGSRIVLGDWYEQMSVLEYSDGRLELTAGDQVSVIR